MNQTLVYGIVFLVVIVAGFLFLGTDIFVQEDIASEIADTNVEEEYVDNIAEVVSGFPDGNNDEYSLEIKTLDSLPLGVALENRYTAPPLTYEFSFYANRSFVNSQRVPHIDFGDGQMERMPYRVCPGDGCFYEAPHTYSKEGEYHVTLYSLMQQEPGDNGAVEDKNILSTTVLSVQ
jgi:hypothetical protein